MCNTQTSKAFYNENSDFKQYVDKNAKAYNKTVDEVLQMRITDEYLKSLLKGGCNSKNQGKGEIE